jgi:hypothetical protein
MPLKKHRVIQDSGRFCFQVHSKAEPSTVSTQLEEPEQQISERVEIYTKAKQAGTHQIQEEIKALAAEKQELEAKVAIPPARAGSQGRHPHGQARRIQKGS